jgi:hypothetical protein
MPLTRSTHSLFILLITLSLAAGACSDDPITVQEGLTEAEVEGVLRFLYEVEAFDPALDDVTPRPCPDGGSVVFDVTRSLEATAVAEEGFEDFQDCAGRASGRVFRLQGRLDLSVLYYLDEFGRIIDVDGSLSGGLDWATEGRTGSCRLDLIVIPPASSVSGTACGLAVSQSFD